MSDGIRIDYLITYIIMLCFLLIKSRLWQENVIYLNYTTLDWLKNMPNFSDLG